LTRPQEGLKLAEITPYIPLMLSGNFRIASHRQVGARMYENAAVCQAV